MFTLVYGDDLGDFPELADQMFRDRAVQFRDKLGWDLSVDAAGREIDAYDAQNPLYVMLRDADGRHLASGRLLPTTGPTMIADHFSDLTDGVEIESPLIWEVTRVFVARHDREAIRHAAALMWAGCRFGLRAGVQFFVSVTPTPMTRVFGACGWPAEIIGRRDYEGDGEICACLWELNEEVCERLAKRAGLDPDRHRLTVYRPRRVREEVSAFPSAPWRGAEIEGKSVWPVAA